MSVLNDFDHFNFLGHPGRILMGLSSILVQHFLPYLWETGCNTVTGKPIF